MTHLLGDEQLHFDLKEHRTTINVPSYLNIQDLSHKYHIFPLRVIYQNNRRRLLLAMSNPKNISAIADTEFQTGMPVIPVSASHGDIEELIAWHYPSPQSSNTTTYKLSRTSLVDSKLKTKGHP